MPSLKTNQTTRFAGGAVRVPRASGAEFGGGTGLQQAGKALTQLSGEMMAAQQRVDNRNNTVARARAFNEYNGQVNDEMLRLQTEGDLTDPQQLTDFGIFTKEKAQTLLEAHTGSADSRAQLTIRLGSLQANAAQKMGIQANAAGRQLVNDSLSTNIGAIAGLAGRSGDIQTGFDAVDIEVTEAAAALTPAEEAAQRIGGRASVISEVFGSNMEHGDIEAAKLTLTTPGIETMFQPEELRKMRSQIITQERTAEKGRIEGEQRLIEASTVSGIPVDELTPDQRLRLSKLTPPVGRVTLQDKVNDYVEVFGEPPSKDQMNIMAGTFIPDVAVGDAPFGKGLTGLSLARLTDDSTAFASGALTAEDDARYLAAATSYTQPVSFTNPDTGLVETRRAELPPAAIQAFARRNIPIPGAVDGIPIPGEQDITDINAELPPPDQTIFGLAELVSGPVSGLAAVAGRTPVLGEVFRPVEIEQARSKVQLFTRQLVRVFQNNPKFSEAERQSIEREIDLSPSSFDTKGAFQSRVIAIDDSLIARQKQAQGVLASSLSGRGERQQAMREVNAVEAFRLHLGAPPLVKSAEEARKLPEGAVFRTPDGRVMINKAIQ